ncbi:MAG TPA: hypothetical protein VLK84_19450 [Longimicrobium sp.]|nr:hypothetical protein [Longimicrobium sp.]
MIITTAVDLEGVPASPAAFQAIIPALEGQEDPFAILYENRDSLAFMQTLWTPSGYLLEHQEGSLANHFRTVREDLSAEEVITAFQSFAAGESAWRTSFEYRRIEVRSRWYRLGQAIGKAWGDFRAGYAESRAAARRRE